MKKKGNKGGGGGGVFSFQELDKLKDFCKDCAKENKEIEEKRKKDPSYVPEEKQPEPAPVKEEFKGYNGTDYYVKGLDDKDIDIILNPNYKPNKTNKASTQITDSFNNRMNMFEPKK